MHVYNLFIEHIIQHVYKYSVCVCAYAYLYVYTLLAVLKDVSTIGSVYSRVQCFPTINKSYESSFTHPRSRNRLGTPDVDHELNKYRNGKYLFTLHAASTSWSGKKFTVYLYFISVRLGTELKLWYRRAHDLTVRLRTVHIYVIQNDFFNLIYPVFNCIHSYFINIKVKFRVIFVPKI